MIGYTGMADVLSSQYGNELGERVLGYPTSWAHQNWEIMAMLAAIL